MRSGTNWGRGALALGALGAFGSLIPATFHGGCTQGSRRGAVYTDECFHLLEVVHAEKWMQLVQMVHVAEM